jgi:hypothetical protein
MANNNWLENWENRHIIEYESPASPDFANKGQNCCESLDCQKCFPAIPVDVRSISPISSVYSFESEEFSDVSSTTSGIGTDSNRSDSESEISQQAENNSTDFDETYFSVSLNLFFCFYLFYLQVVLNLHFKW